MSKPNHTPVPWVQKKVGGQGIHIGGLVDLGKDTNGERLMDLYTVPIRPELQVGSDGRAYVRLAYEIYTGFGEPQSFADMQEANAAFIVRACNAHDDLLAACKAAMAFKERVFAPYEAGSSKEVAAKLRDAIEKAEEGP